MSFRRQGRPSPALRVSIGTPFPLDSDRTAFWQIATGNPSWSAFVTLVSGLNLTQRRVGTKGETLPQSGRSASSTYRQPSGPPIGLDTVAGNGKVTLTWSPPSHDGGLSIARYGIYRGSSRGADKSLGRFPVHAVNMTPRAGEGRERRRQARKRRQRRRRRGERGAGENAPTTGSARVRRGT